MDDDAHILAFEPLQSRYELRVAIERERRVATSILEIHVLNNQLHTGTKMFLESRNKLTIHTRGHNTHTNLAKVLDEHREGQVIIQADPVHAHIIGVDCLICKLFALVPPSYDRSLVECRDMRYRQIRVRVCEDARERVMRCTADDAVWARA